MSTFADVLKETQERHRKSDLENLAHAYTILERHVSECEDLLAEIKAAGEKPLPEGTVKRLYDRATKLAI